MLAATLTFDHARSAEKMADWHCVGEDNPAWKEGPYLSLSAIEEDINHNYPYCFRTRVEFCAVSGIVIWGKAGSIPKWRSKNTSSAKGYT